MRPTRLGSIHRPAPCYISRRLGSSLTFRAGSFAKSSQHSWKAPSIDAAHLSVATCYRVQHLRPHATKTPIPEPAPITAEEYHKKSDSYIEGLVEVLEEIQEGREDVDVEYSAGVLTLAFPPAGIYVINKQPPNKQIWLSSPVSGPKRYDYVVVDGAKSGKWIYLRDGSGLTDLLQKELDTSLHELDGSC